MIARPWFELFSLFLVVFFFCGGARINFVQKYNASLFAYDYINQQSDINCSYTCMQRCYRFFILFFSSGGKKKDVMTQWTSCIAFDFDLFSGTKERECDRVSLWRLRGF